MTLESLMSEYCLSLILPHHHLNLNIVRVTSYLELGEKVVVCCSHGMNRSNAIALGVLVQHFRMDFFEALELIKSKVPICTIISANIVALTKLFNVKFT